MATIEQKELYKGHYLTKQEIKEARAYNEWQANAWWHPDMMREEAKLLDVPIEAFEKESFISKIKRVLWQQ